MLVLNPEVVRFETFVWEDASAVTLERSSTRTVEQWGDAGKHPAFVDVAEARTGAKVVRKLGASESSTPALGAQGDLVFYTSASGGDTGRVRVKVRCVVVSVKTELSAPELAHGGAVQTIAFVGVSTDGAVDPVTIEDGSVV